MKNNKRLHIYLILMIFIFSVFIYPQDRKLMNLIENDSPYLYHLYVIPNRSTNEIPEELKNKFNSIREGVFKENKTTAIKDPEGNITDQSISYNYNIYYSLINENEICPLSIEQKQTIDDGKISERYDIVFTVSDFKEMYDKDEREFEKVQDFIKGLEKNARKPYLNNQQDAEKNINKPGYIPFAKIIESNHYEQRLNENVFYTQVKYPGVNISVSHNRIEDSEAIGLNSFGLLFGLRKDELLNLHEYQNPIWTYGIFSLIKIDSFYLDLNVIRQNKLDNKEIKKALPLFDYKKVEINKTPALIFDLSFFGLIGDYELPVINLFLALGKRDFSNPTYFRYLNLQTKQAYFSCSQWKATTSFFWNTDKNGYNKFKFNIGAGAYDIFRVLFDENDKVTSKTKDKKIPIQPVLNLEYIHDSEKSKFGTSVGIFDNQITFGAWLKIIEIGPSELRVDESYISEPFGRSVKPWENKNGSNFIQLIFRYELNR